HKGDGNGSVERLCIKQILVSQGDCKLREHHDLRYVEGEGAASGLYEPDEMPEVMRVLEVHPVGGENGLEPLLDGLLGMEDQDAVRDLGVALDLTRCHGVVVRLLSKDRGELFWLKLRR